MNGLTQVKLAEQCGLSSNYIMEIENARKFPTVDVIETLARILRIEPYQLFQDDPSAQASPVLVPRNQMAILKERLVGSMNTIFKDFDLL